MLTPTDLDALLVSALYGELSSDERTALDAHLAVTPGDRDVLHALTQARAIIHNSGWLNQAHMIDPPSAVSAKLVRVAASSAPREGLWARFTDMMASMGRHPAMAAAAMAVVVAGAAGAIYLRGGGMHEASAPAPAMVATAATASGDMAGSAAPAYLGLADQVERLEEGKSKEMVQVAPTGGAGAAAAVSGRSTSASTTPVAPGPERDRGAVAISADLLDKHDAKLSKPADEQVPAATRSIPVTTVDGMALKADDQAGEPVADKAAAAPPPSMAGTADALVAARGLHDQLVKLVAAGKCADAGKLGRTIADSYPGYYASDVASDRRVRACKAYIERSLAKPPATKPAPGKIDPSGTR